MLIPLKPRHLCPSCSAPQIADCYFAAMRVPIFGRNPRQHYCPICRTHIWYHAKRSIPLLLVRVVAIALLLPWGLSIPSIVSAEFGGYFGVCILLGVSLMLTEILRGSVVTRPPRNLVRS